MRRRLRAENHPQLVTGRNVNRLQIYFSYLIFSDSETCHIAPITVRRDSFDLQMERPAIAPAVVHIAQGNPHVRLDYAWHVRHLHFRRRDASDLRERHDERLLAASYLPAAGIDVRHVYPAATAGYFISGFIISCHPERNPVVKAKMLIYLEERSFRERSAHRHPFYYWLVRIVRIRLDGTYLYCNLVDADRRLGKRRVRVHGDVQHVFVNSEFIKQILHVFGLVRHLRRIRIYLIHLGHYAAASGPRIVVFGIGPGTGTGRPEKLLRDPHRHAVRMPVGLQEETGILVPRLFHAVRVYRVQLVDRPDCQFSHRILFLLT